MARRAGRPGRLYPDLLRGGGGDVSAQGGGVLASSSLRLGRVADAEHGEMSDFDSNPFADPDLNNPFKVSSAPGIARRRGASLLVKTGNFLGAHRAAPLPPRLGRRAAAPLSGVSPRPPRETPPGGSPPGPRAARLGVGAEPGLRVRPALPTSPAEGRRALAREWARAPGECLALPWGAGGERPGQVELSPAGPGRAARAWGSGARAPVGLSWGLEVAAKSSGG